MKQLMSDDKVALRALEPDDLGFLYSMENNPEVWNVSNTLSPFSKYILKQYIENSHLDIYTTKQLRLIIEKKSPKIPIGAIDLFDFDPYHMRAGIGIVIEPDEQNNGYASSALTLLLNYCFNHLLLHQLYCNIAVSNNRSIKLFQKAGFSTIGIKKEWIKTISGWEDEYMLQIINPKI